VIADLASAATTPWHGDATVAVAAASPRRSALRSAPFLLAFGFGGICVAVVAHHGAVPRAYSATSTSAAIIDLTAGLGLILAGSISWFDRQRRSIGPLAALVGVAWLSVDVIGWADGPAIARSVAMVVEPFIVPLVVHLVVAFPSGRVIGPLVRASVAVTYLVTAAISVGLALWRDPFRDRYCWSNCADNTFLVHSNPVLARSLTAVWLTCSLAVGVGLAASIACRLALATPTARRSLVPVLGPGFGVALTVALYAGLRLLDRLENPEHAAFMVVFVARAFAFAFLSAGVGWVVLRERHRRWSVAQLAAELGAAPPPGSLATALARSLGDQRLEVAYWLPDTGCYVDATGRPVDPDHGPTRAVTPIARRGVPVAIVIHDRSLRTTHDLEHEIGSASRLAVDNERLQAQASAQLAALQASRARIVETSNNTRRQLERNLHDGAQQRLLALSYELQLAESDARAAGNIDLAGVLAAAAEKAATALVELRDLAHGIFPVILSEAGLAAALATFVDTAPLPITLVDVPDRRFPDDAESAAYLMVTSAVAHAVKRSATRLAATFTDDTDNLRIELVDDGSVSTVDDLNHIHDRIGAIGGHCDVTRSGVSAVIPCGS
jgi:signal transduction histidine kinase